MSDQNESDDVTVDAAFAQGLPEQGPPAGFVERVLHRQRRGRRRRLVAMTSLSALAASVTLLLLIPREMPREGADGASPEQAGELVATQRKTVVVDRATVVAEAGARLSWKTQGDAVRFSLGAGSAFFRVDPGSSAVVVDTPAGSVTVFGTCFSVTLDPLEENMPVLTLHPKLSTAAASALAGAVLSAAAVVTVYEGKVSVENSHGASVVQAGESASLSPQRAPRIAAGEQCAAEARTQAALARSDAALSAAAAAAAGDTRGLLEQNKSLQSDVATLEQQVELLQAEQRADRGEALAFPDDLPPRFSEAALVAAFNSALKEAGLEGELTSMDCTEYPCIAYGTVQQDTRDLSKSLRATPSMSTYDNDDWSVSGWHRNEGGRESFAVVLQPDGEAGRDANIVKRLRWRIDQGREDPPKP